LAALARVKEPNALRGIEITRNTKAAATTRDMLL